MQYEGCEGYGGYDGHDGHVIEYSVSYRVQCGMKVMIAMLAMMVYIDVLQAVIHAV